MTREELDERLKAVSFYDVDDSRYFELSDDPEKVDEFKQLIRDCIEAVTPARPVVYDDDPHDNEEWNGGYNNAIDNIEANTKELLG